MAASDQPDLPRIAEQEPRPNRMILKGKVLDESRAMFPEGSTTIIEENWTEVGPNGVRVSCTVKHRPVPRSRDFVLIACFDKDGASIESFQVYRKASLVIVAIDWEQKAFKFSADSDPAEIAKFLANAMVCQKVLAFQKLDQRHQVPSPGQMLIEAYTEVNEVPEKTFSALYSTNELNGTFHKVENGWIFLNPKAWEDFRSKIWCRVLDPAVDNTFVLSLHHHSWIYVYPRIWTDQQSGAELDNHELTICSEEDWAQGNYRPAQLRPGTCYVKLGFLINHWDGNPNTKPDAEGWTEEAAPFVWKSSPFTPF